MMGTVQIPGDYQSDEAHDGLDAFPRRFTLLDLR